MNSTLTLEELEYLEMLIATNIGKEVDITKATAILNKIGIMKGELK